MATGSADILHSHEQRKDSHPERKNGGGTDGSRAMETKDDVRNDEHTAARGDAETASDAAGSRKGLSLDKNCSYGTSC